MKVLIRLDWIRLDRYDFLKKNKFWQLTVFLVLYPFKKCGLEWIKNILNWLNIKINGQIIPNKNKSISGIKK